MSQRSRPHPEQHPATLAALEWPRLLDALRARLATDHGKEQLAALAPLTRPGAVRHALSLVSEVKTLRAGEGRLDFGGVRVLHPLLERAVRQGRLEVEELAAVLSTQRAALQLQAELRSAPALEGLQELAGVLHPLRELVGRLAEALTPAGALNESHYPELRRLRAELNARRDAIHARLEGLLRSSRLAAVFQDHLYTLRGRRYVLPVKADFRGQLPGIVHDVSASGHTLFVEPQAVVEDTNALTMGEKRLELETDRILRELSAHVGEADGGLRENLDWIGRLDLLHAQAVLSEDYRGTAPRVAQEGVLALKGLAHPLMLLEAPEVESASQPALESAAEPAAQPAGEPHGGRGGAAHPPSPVRNDLSLGGETRGLVISGANTGGKTVLLKAIGLSVLLVRHGMHVPAREGSRCDLFDAVWADIGDQQSLETSLSTFSAQIAFLADCLPRVGPGSLVLLDEMLTGTEPAQGAALAGVVLEALLASGAATIVTTHFGELKELAARQPGLANAAMSFDPRRLRPTYRLQVGLPGASYALDIARRYGLDETLVERAQEALAHRPAALDALLVQYQQARHALESEADDQRRRAGQLRRREESLAGREAALAERERAVRRRERGEIGAELRRARRRIAEVIEGLQQANTLPLAGKVRERLADLEREHALEPAWAAGNSTGGAGGKAGTADLAALAPGTELWVPSLERRATLEAVLDEGERARVRLGAITLELEADALAPLAGPEAGAEAAAPSRRRRKAAPPAAGGAAAALPETTAEIPFALSTGDNTLDLRGLRLDEALEQTGRFFDRCTVKHVSPVLLIHGHGTGRLKAGLRERLASDPYVAAFRPGAAGEGRDGVTVVALNV